MSDLEKIKSLSPAFIENGTITAATSSPISIGAAAILVTSEKFAKENFRVAIIDLPGQGLSTRFGNPSTVIHVSDFELYFKAMNFLMKFLNSFYLNLMDYQ